MPTSRSQQAARNAKAPMPKSSAKGKAKAAKSKPATSARKAPSKAKAAPAKGKKAQGKAAGKAAGKANGKANGKAAAKASLKAAGGKGCPALDPFGGPCQNTPRFGSRYCGVHSHLEPAR